MNYLYVDIYMFSTQFLSQTSNCVCFLLPFCLCPCPLLISCAGCYLEHPGGDVLENPTAAVSHSLNTQTYFYGTVWEIRLLIREWVFGRVVLTQMITLIPGRDGKGTGKRGCQLMPFEVTHKIGEEEVKSTLLILSLWLAKGKTQKTHDPPPEFLYLATCTTSLLAPFTLPVEMLTKVNRNPPTAAPHHM